MSSPEWQEGSNKEIAAKRSVLLERCRAQTQRVVVRPIRWKFLQFCCSRDISLFRPYAGGQGTRVCVCVCVCTSRANVLPSNGRIIRDDARTAREIRECTSGRASSIYPAEPNGIGIDALYRARKTTTARRGRRGER